MSPACGEQTGNIAGWSITKCRFAMGMEESSNGMDPALTSRTGNDRKKLCAAAIFISVKDSASPTWVAGPSTPQVFGMPAFGQDENGLFLRVAEHCIGVDLASKAQEPVGIEHFCIGIEGFDPDKARKVLAAESIETFTELGTGVFFRDADGNKVQVSAPNYPD
jgi:hypothetical protein